MSNLTTSRTLFICVVPAVIALISVYWMRKKKKFKHSDPEPQTVSALDNEKVDSLAECSLDSSCLDSADTLSDASSFASPESSSEKSLRTKNFTTDDVVKTKNFPLENATDFVVRNNAFCDSSNPVTPQPSSVKISPMPSRDFQTLNGTKAANLDGSLPDIVLCDGVDKSERCNLLSSLDKPVKCNLLSSLDLEEVTKFDVDRHSLSNEEESASDIFSRLMPNFNSDSMNAMEALEEMLGFSPSSLRIVENGILHSNESSDNVVSPARVIKESEKLQTAETDSNDSHSSVLDENSLSYVSDDSDKQASGLKNKGSLLSDFDESLCDELDKSCSPILLPSKSVFASDGDAAIVDEKIVAEVKAVLDFAQAPATKTPVKDEFAAIDQCPNSVNGPMQLPEAGSSLGSDSTDSPPEPNSSATGHIESSSKTPASCDSSAIAFVPLAKSSSSIVSPASLTGPSPETTLKLMNGDGAEDPQIPDMDISEHLSTKSVPSLTGMENENCSESSGWEMQDSQSDAFSQSKSEEGALAGSKAPENSSTQYVYEFELPQELCGRLIGKHGKHVKSIKDRSHANVYIKRHPYDPQLKIVVVEGMPFLYSSMRLPHLLFLSCFDNNPRLVVDLRFLYSSMRLPYFYVQFLSYFDTNSWLVVDFVRGMQFLYSSMRLPHLQFLSYFDNNPRRLVVDFVRGMQFLYSSMRLPYLQFLSYFDNNPRLTIEFVGGMPFLYSNMLSIIKVCNSSYYSLIAHYFDNNLKIVVVEGMPFLLSCMLKMFTCADRYAIACYYWLTLGVYLRVVSYLKNNRQLKMVGGGMPLLYSCRLLNLKLFTHVVHYFINNLQLKMVIGMQFLLLPMLSNLKMFTCVVGHVISRYSQLKVVEGVWFLLSCILSVLKVVVFGCAIACYSQLKLVIVKDMRFLNLCLHKMFTCVVGYAISCYSKLKIVVVEEFPFLYLRMLPSLKMFTCIVGYAISCYYWLTLGVFFSVVRYLTSSFVQFFKRLFCFGKRLFARLCFLVKCWLLRKVFYFINILKSTNIFSLIKDMWVSFKK